MTRSDLSELQWVHIGLNLFSRRGPYVLLDDAAVVLFVTYCPYPRVVQAIEAPRMTPRVLDNTKVTASLKALLGILSNR